MEDNVVRIADYERKSKDADAVSPRNPADADVIRLPCIRKLNAPAPSHRSFDETELENY
jgi:hypothetical protein